MAKPFSSRILPRRDMILVRKHVPSKTGALKLVEKDPETGKLKEVSAPTVRSMGIVVAVGPGEHINGSFVPMDPELIAGVTVMFPTEAAFTFRDVKEMEEEGLYFVSASTIWAIVKPEGLSLTGKTASA